MLADDNARVKWSFRAAIITAIISALLFGTALGLVWPQVSGDTIYKKSGTVVDASHAADGYICAKHTAGSKRLKLRISKNDTTYTYDLNSNGEYEVYPLQMGSGTYKVQVYQQASGSQYAQASSLSFKVSLNREDAAFLCPSQYVWYEENYEAVKKSLELCTDDMTDAQKVRKVYEYITSHWVYHHMRALTVKSGYIPDLEGVYKEKMGICFDFAALMACMLRVQGIPTQIVIGYADNVYHAWNIVTVDGTGSLLDPTGEVTNVKVKNYTQERVY